MTSVRNCRDDKSCFYEQEDGLGYIKSATALCDCQLVQCPNFTYCHATRPKVTLNGHGGFCLHCNMGFGQQLKIEERADECDICLDSHSTFVKRVECSHFCCLSCFHRIWDSTDDQLDAEDEDDNDLTTVEDSSTNQELLKRCHLCRQAERPAWNRSDVTQ